MQTFIYGLLLACVSGVTVVAFRHPRGFARLFPYLLAVITAIFAGINIWHVAIEVAWTKLLPYILEESLAEAATTKHLLRPSYAWVAFWYVGVVVFLWIMLKLPPFLQITDKEGGKPGEPEDRNE